MMLDKDIFVLVFAITFVLSFLLMLFAICSRLCKRNAIYRSQSTANIIPTGAQQSSSIQDIGAVSSSTIPPVDNQIFPYPASSVLITTPYPANPPPVNPYIAAALNSHKLYQEALPPPNGPSNPSGCAPYPVNVSQCPPIQPFVSTTWSQSNPPYPVNPQMPYNISQASVPSQRFE